jgi:hypothetical protein
MKVSTTRVVGAVAFTFALVIAGFIALSPVGHNVAAGPEVSGSPEGASARYLIADGTTVKRIVYVTTGVKTMANTTPVASDPQCGNFGGLHKAEVVLNGTMAGTAPTLTIKWQNSIDGGTTWNDVGTWTAINATVTPLVQSQAVSDILNAATAVAYGDCWRATYTFGGTGTVTADFSIKGIEK